MLCARNLFYSANRKNILSDVSLELKAGQFTALIGPNGSGKSTLLKLLSGLSPPSTGTVTLNGKNVSDYTKAKLAQHRAVLSQSIHLGFPISNRDVIGMGLQEEVLCKSVDMLIQDAFDTTGTKISLDDSYDDCSGGEKTLVQMSRILVQLWSSEQFPEQVLFLDEPTAALDINYQLKLLSLCKELSKKGMAVFCILHDMQLAAHFADQVLLMNQGQIVDQGRPKDIINNGSIDDVFRVNSLVVEHPQNQNPMLMVCP